VRNSAQAGPLLCTWSAAPEWTGCCCLGLDPERRAALAGSPADKRTPPCAGIPLIVKVDWMVRAYQYKMPVATSHMPVTGPHWDAANVMSPVPANARELSMSAAQAAMRVLAQVQ
jgi:hypothetical protein